MSREADLEVLQAIDLVRLCQATSTLPLPGGLLDQDSYFVFLLKTILKADEEKQQLERARSKLKGR